jgi:hypothetical protein
MGRTAMKHPMLLTCWFGALCLTLGVAGPGAQDSTARRVFPLEETSSLDDRGHPCVCSEQADPNVAYPAFTSGKPLYGLLRVDMEFGEERSGTPYPFALDESAGTGTGYDRLYVDLNLNGNLADESPVTALKDPPASALITGDWIRQQTCFASVAFSSGSPTTGMHTMPTLPRLVIGDQGYITLAFVATKARKGEILMAGRRFSVTIVNSYPLGTRWDRPGTVVKLETRNGPTSLPSWWGADRLLALHEFHETLWRLGTTPEGDQLIVEPYRGDFGTLQVGAARKLAWTKTVVGSLRGQDRAVAVGDNSDIIPKPVSSARIPVGRYTPAYLTVRYGPLLIDVSENYHSDGKPRQRDTPAAHNIDVRKDETFLLNFSRRADVLFTSPARSTRVKAGAELRVMAVLVDPKLDIMIRGLRRNASESLPPGTALLFAVAIVGPLGFWLLAGRKRRIYRLLPIFAAVALLLFVGSLVALHYWNVGRSSAYGSAAGFDELTPSVVVARANGEIVARGAMPFG